MLYGRAFAATALNAYLIQMCENVRSSCHEASAGTNYLDFASYPLYFWFINQA